MNYPFNFRRLFCCIIAKYIYLPRVFVCMNFRNVSMQRLMHTKCPRVQTLCFYSWYLAIYINTFIGRNVHSCADYLFKNNLSRFISTVQSVLPLLLYAREIDSCHVWTESLYCRRNAGELRRLSAGCRYRNQS